MEKEIKQKETFFKNLYLKIGEEFQFRPYKEFEEFLEYCKNSSKISSRFTPIFGIEGNDPTEDEYYSKKLKSKL